ncbi:hypothetical protein DSO57_1019902 [Entomophthora muscae]|uniref:Uncharacterized protein n=1 Tax=Entomophthora muscae TaxID=34485 RepID=A0ACC2TF94_9FUNG|nr:hypothetical protein DSO57_1019902 [Entomophthora muscae]
MDRFIEFSFLIIIDKPVQKRVPNPGHDYLQAVSPKDQGAICLNFFGIDSPQAEAENTFKDKDISTKLEFTAPDERQDKLHNEGKEIPTISFMSLKSTQMTNQDSSPEENSELKASP